MLVIYILNILKEHSTDGSPLTQAEIMEILEKEYNIRPDRKTLRTVLNNLKSDCKSVKYSENSRKGWYFDGLLTQGEFDTVMRALMLSPEAERTDIDSITEKLCAEYGGISCEKYKNIVRSEFLRQTEEKGVFETVHRAITERRMIIFSVYTGRSDGFAEYEREPDGFVREYLVRPISLLAHNGGFSLLGSLGDSGKMKFFPLERIHGALISNVECKVMPHFPEGASVYPENAAEIKYPRGGARSEIIVKARADALYELQQSFKKVTSVRIGENLFEARFVCNLNAAKRYLLTLGDSVEVISPAPLRGEMAAVYFRMAERYRKG